MAEETDSTQVELTIPCKPEFVGVARLAILGVASRMQFSYDEVEDVRLAVGEACTISVEWAERNNRTDAQIKLRGEIAPDKLTIDIFDAAGPREPAGSTGSATEEESLGALLITLLVDEIKVEPKGEGTHVRMVKYAGQR